jgi:hypothetical protein
MTTPALTTSTVGPRWVTFIGIALLVAGLGAGVGSLVMFARALPTGIVAADGSLGDAVILAVDPGGSGTATLDGGTTYGLWLVGDEDVLVSQAPVVTGPDGSSAQVIPTAVDATVDIGGVSALYVWDLRTDAAGTYTVQADPACKATLALTPAESSLDIVTSVSLTLLLVFVAVGLGAAGIGLVIGGGVWWSHRRHNQRRLSEAEQAA